MDEYTERSLPTPEAAIVFRARKGDREAISELFNRLQQPLLNYLYHMLGYRQEVEDIGQEAFIRAFERLDKLGPPWDFKSWLFRIASNLAVDFLRSEQRFMSEEEIEREEPSGGLRPTERRVEQEEQRQTIWNTLEALPTSYRQALLLRESGDFSYEEIANTLECTLENARQLVHRARQRFQDFYWMTVTTTLRPQPCLALENLLGTFPPGRLDQEQLGLVRAHVASCSECRERRKSLAAAGALLAGLPPFLPSEAWRKMALAQIWRRLSSPPATSLQAEAQAITRQHARLDLQQGEALQTRVSQGSRGANIPTGKGGVIAGQAPKTCLYLIGLGAIPLVGMAIVLGGLILYSVLTYFSGSSEAPAPTSTLAGVTASTPNPLLEASPTTTTPPSASPTATFTPTLTTTTTPPAPTARFLQNAHCRKGPSMDYEIVTSLLQGTIAGIEGRNQGSSWWWILLPNSSGHCWVWSGLVEASGNLSELLLIPAPPLPLAEASVTPTTIQGCWVYEPKMQKNVCVAPCPANAKPGGACTP